jgi:5-(hydroxymethyl)furfural/furfural oxidase
VAWVSRHSCLLTQASSDPHVPPQIQLNVTDDPHDLNRLRAGVHLAWQIAHQPEIARHMHHVALLSEQTISSDDALTSYIRATVSARFHPCRTARIGRPMT